MNGLRKLATIFLATVLAAFAAPAFAAKIYTMVVQSTGTNTVAVTIHNVTPENNSTINSFVIDGPDGTTLSQPWSSSAAATIQSDGNGNVRVNGFNGLKSANKNPNTITINLTVDWGTAGAPSCGSPPNWTATAYTGNFSSTTFQLVDAADTNVNINSVPMALNCFTLTGLPTSISAGTSNKTYAATLTNLNGAGGPSITALSIGASTSGVSATAAALSTPLAPGLSVGVTVTVSTACGSSLGNWSSSAVGSGSVTFTGTTASAAYSVNPCTVSFDPGPPDKIGNNVEIAPAVTVSAKDGEGNSLAWNGDVDWLVIAQPGTGADTGSVNDPAGTCVNTLAGGLCSAYSFGGLKVTGTIGGSYKLTATTSIGTAVDTTSTTSDAFTVWGGILGCDATNRKAGLLNPGALVTYVKESDQGKWGLVRGNNKNEVACVPVPYTFVLDVMSTPQLASFIVPDPLVTPFQQVAAEYVVVWGRVAVNAAGDGSSWTTKRPMLSWGTPALPVPGTPDFVPALSCVLDPDNPDLIPIPYPNGFASVSPGALAGLLPIIPNVPPFSTSPHAQYRPFLADNVTPQRAKMCIAQQGWTAVGPDDPGGPTLVQYWTKVIDQADGFMSLD